MRIRILIDPRDEHDHIALYEAEQWIDRHARRNVVTSRNQDEDDWIVADFDFRCDDDARAFLSRDAARRHRGRIVA